MDKGEYHHWLTGLPRAELEDVADELHRTLLRAAAEALATRAKEIEWRGCGCSQREESACPACDGRKPLNDADRSIPEFYGHRENCWIAAAIRALKVT